MADVIKLLPDSIANQIAAGEVIQRPASAVKEMLENAIDAGGKNIKLILKDAGKTLVQVIDDGCGMSETDARLCFERHATSKIQTAADLFALRTMGFRGEALASVAAVAQVELRTRQRKSDVGTRIVIEGFEFKSQEICQTPIGTNIQVKNLFFNVPARRNFLKSNTVEMRHILDEFERIALAYPDIHFSLNHNGQEIYHLAIGNLRQRIVGILGKDANPKLVPISESTDIVSFSGFVGKPEFARKTRGEQFFFVNGRFIKSPYLDHAVRSAFEDLLPRETHPFYVIFIEIDPSRIDVNVHPTKQEIKFDDDRLVYNYLRVAVRHALGQNAVTPTLDFDQDAALLRVTSMPSNRQTDDNEWANNFMMNNFGNTFSANFQRFTENNSTISDLSDVWKSEREPKTKTPIANNSHTKSESPTQKSNINKNNGTKNWQTLYEGLNFIIEDDETANATTINNESANTENQFFIQHNKWESEQNLFEDGEGETLESAFSADDDTPLSNEPIKEKTSPKEPYQIHSTYIVSHIKSGFLLIDQQAAHERILYEKYLTQLEQKQVLTQAELFPCTLRFTPSDALILHEILPLINQLGYDIREFGKNSFVVQGIPADVPKGSDAQKLVEMLLEQFKNETDLRLGINERLARALTRSSAIKRGTPLSTPEMQSLIDQLFACSMPFKSPTGRACFLTFDLEKLSKDFSN